ncbi:ASCH domain-containing protein [Paenibacillus lentus]|uniref:ASCH domain-containing protein n=1 Tax=Paenibacillus lentus TaxID=1338368 RepID=A0A3S8RTU6_9BACL|nr:ASCH domain-containing protein [Paenibacillus lentus]AZK46411.1 ASCH domain-containing protein [Paenibacillus lentus]
MKAITIHQPWATLIALGEKRFETRTWDTNYRGPIAIHAGKQIDQYACEEPEIKAALAKHEFKASNLPTGAVIAVCELAGSYQIYDTIDNGTHIVRCPNDRYDFDKVEYIRRPERNFGWWESGSYAWELDNVRMLSEPIPAKGMQRLWNWEGVQ